MKKKKKKSSLTLILTMRFNDHKLIITCESEDRTVMMRKATLPVSIRQAANMFARIWDANGTTPYIVENLQGAVFYENSSFIYNNKKYSI